MYKSASRFMNGDRLGSFAGTALEPKAPPGRTPSPMPSLPPGKMTIEEREQLGHGKPDQDAFLVRIQTAVTAMVKDGIRDPRKQAARLNALRLRPYSGAWTARLVVMFYERQKERAKAQKELEAKHRANGERTLMDGTKGAIRRTDRAPSNPVLSEELANKLLWKITTIGGGRR